MAAAVAALGALLGLLWGKLAPAVPVIKLGDGSIVVTDPSPEQYIAADGWFTLLGLGFGLIVTIVAWLALRRDRGPFLLIGIVGGAFVAGRWVAPAVGQMLGRDAYEEWRTVATQGATYLAPPEVQSLGPKLVPAFIAAIVLTLLAGWSNDPDLDHPGAQPGYGPNHGYPPYPGDQPPYGAPGAAPSGGESYGVPGAASSGGEPYGASGIGPSGVESYGMPGSAPSGGEHFGAPGAGPSGGESYGTPGSAPSGGETYGAPGAGPSPYGSGGETYGASGGEPSPYETPSIEPSSNGVPGGPTTPSAAPTDALSPYAPPSAPTSGAVAPQRPDGESVGQPPTGSGQPHEEPRHPA
ncbi:hypothetical protein [Actinoplanes philippinensis]|uniref:hypothetical protein n=1 Tax=Actinoplanes philippinensis TaxID=35752 RepID=UPI0033DB2592